MRGQHPGRTWIGTRPSEVAEHVETLTTLPSSPGSTATLLRRRRKPVNSECMRNLAKTEEYMMQQIDHICDY